MTEPKISILNNSSERRTELDVMRIIIKLEKRGHKRRCTNSD